MSALTDATNIIQQQQPVGEDVVVEKTAPEVVETPTSEIVEESATEVQEVPAGEREQVDVPVEGEETVEKEQEQEEKEETTEQKHSRLTEKLISGRRFLKTNDFHKATEALSEAAALSAELYGEGHEDTFECTFLYGQSLLELAKIEDEVLTNALMDIPKDAKDGEDVENSDDVVTEEERAEIKQQVEEALGVSEDVETPEDVQASEPVETSEDGVAKPITENSSENPEETETKEDSEDVNMEEEGKEGTDEAKEEGEDDDDDDEEDPMKLAWELLETARCICEKKIKSLEATDIDSLKTWNLNHADVLSSLGEHGIVDSKCEQAQRDLTEALRVQTAHLPTTSRLLANTNHLLAKAYGAESLFEKAAEHYSNAKNILMARVEELKNLKDGLEGSEDEIKDLEELIPELDAFIVDALASGEATDKIKEAARKELESAAELLTKFGEEEVKDISGMVRRPVKRAVADSGAEDVQDSDEGQEAKKSKIEEIEKTDGEEVKEEVKELKSQE